MATCSGDADEHTPLNNGGGRRKVMTHSAEDVFENEPSNNGGGWRTIPQRKGSKNMRASLSRAQKISEKINPGFTVGYKQFIESSAGISLVVTIVVLYYVLALVAYGHLFERWSYIDCLYFATLTFTTIGYGDVSPTTDGGLLFTVFFSLYGVFILGYFAGLAGEKFVDYQNSRREKMRNSARRQMTAMFEEQEDGEERKNTRHVVLNLIFDAIRIQIPLVTILLGVGISYGTIVEHWTFIESLYFTVLTFSTVGYGDFAPTEQWVRLACVIFLPLCAFIFCDMIARIASAYMGFKIHQEEEEFLNRQLTQTDLERMDADQNGDVSFGEFLSFILTAMEKVNESDIDDLKALFDRLDVNGDGKLNRDDLQGYRKQKGSRRLMV